MVSFLFSRASSFWSTAFFTASAHADRRQICHDFAACSLVDGSANEDGNEMEMGREMQLNMKMKRAMIMNIKMKIGMRYRYR